MNQDLAELSKGLNNLGIRMVLSDEVLYKYVTFDDAQKIISNQTLNFSSPDRFNDPFDLNESLLDLETDDEMRQQFVSSKMQLVKQIGDHLKLKGKLISAHDYLSE